MYDSPTCGTLINRCNTIQMTLRRMLQAFKHLSLFFSVQWHEYTTVNVKDGT